MENAAIQTLFKLFFNLSESSGGNSAQNSLRLITSIKRKRNVLLVKRKYQQRKICNFWEVISNMPDDVFSSHFRMSINTFKVNH